MPPLETCIERVASRRDHAFSDEAATRHMYQEFASAEIEGRHVVDTPAAGHVEEVVSVILSALGAGSLRYRIPSEPTG